MIKILLIATLLILSVHSDKVNGTKPVLPQVPLQISSEYLFCQGGLINKNCYRGMIQFDGIKKRAYREKAEIARETSYFLHTGRRVFTFSKRERACREQMYSPLQQYWRRIPIDKVQYNGTAMVNRVECHTWFWQEKPDDIHRFAYRVSNATEAVQWLRETGSGIFKSVVQYDFLYFKPREPSFHYFFPPSYCPI